MSARRERKARTSSSSTASNSSSTTRPKRSRSRSSKSSKSSSSKMAHHSSANVIIFERRLLIGVTGFTLIGCILWIVAISTDYWYIITAAQSPQTTPQTTDGQQQQQQKNDSSTRLLQHGVSSALFVRSHAGLWRMCRTNYENGSNEGEGGTLVTSCNYHQLFPSRAEVETNQELDHTMLDCPPDQPRTDKQAKCLDYTRTETAFSIITLLLMVMGHAFSIYTFREPRYMFKRLAGGVHFLTAATILVVVEVLINSVHYASEKLHARHPKGATWHYGFSFILAWMSFVSFVTAGLAFVVCSRKRKGEKAPTELHALSDEPNILSRT